jgi:protein phosphatase 1 regulatory subunit 11
MKVRERKSRRVGVDLAVLTQVCCIYHKPRAFDESSSESESDDEHEHAKAKGQKLRKQARDAKGGELESSESEGGAGDGGAR